MITRIRELNTAEDSEIHLVAERMRLTLVDVLGEQKGTDLYTMDWLVDRVRWHLDTKNTNAKIFLSIDDQGHITGQAIARIDPGSEPFGYFSTLYVEPASRRQGVAAALISHVEQWFRTLKVPRIVYNTAENNKGLLSLFAKFGFRETHRENEMVQLTLRL